MLALLQRVTHAQVDVANQTIAKIPHGLLIFLGVEKNDTKKQADRLLERILGYRIFADEHDRMNLNVTEVNGHLLIVPQFTLAADTEKGLRPSFTTAAPPEIGKKLYDYFKDQAKQKYSHIASGEFGAAMKVSLCNDGPVTFLLQVN